MNQELLEQFKNEIHNKCVAEDYTDATDTTLSDFIINLLSVDKSPAEVSDELVQLVPDYEEAVTDWIFRRKHELETPSSAPAQQQQEQESKATEATKALATAPKPENRIFSRAIGSVIGSHRNSNSQPTTNRSRSRSPDRRSRYDSERYKSRQQEDRHSRHEEDRHSRRDDDRQSRLRREEDRHGSSDIFARLGNAYDGNERNGRNEERPSVFDRLGGAKPIITPPSIPDSKNERCKYWPNCKNGEECTYFHPTTVCPDFPNCPKKAIECMFIHPETSKPVMQAPQIKKLPVPCRFFPYCSNPHCPYMHPAIAPQPYFMHAKPSFAATGQRVQIPCKNGDACTRPDCHFMHPKDPAPAQTEVICKFDGACTRPNCFYKHTKENTGKPAYTKPENMSQRQFSVAEDDVVERIPVGDSADMIQPQGSSNSMEMDEDVVMDVNSS